MQRTVFFHCVHKEIDNAFSPGDNYSFHESDLQITLRLLNSWLRKHSCFAYVISRIRNTNRPKKNLDNVFQSNCSSHAELLTNLRKIEKRPKIRHKAVMHPALQLQQSLLWNSEDMKGRALCDFQRQGVGAALGMVGHGSPEVSLNLLTNLIFCWCNAGWKLTWLKKQVSVPHIFYKYYKSFKNGDNFCLLSHVLSHIGLVNRSL